MKNNKIYQGGEQSLHWWKGYRIFYDGFWDLVLIRGTIFLPQLRELGPTGILATVVRFLAKMAYLITPVS